MKLTNHQIILKNNSAEDCRVVLDIDKMKIVEGQDNISIELSPVNLGIDKGEPDSPCLLRIFALSNYNIKKSSEEMKSWIKSIVSEDKTQEAFSKLHDLLLTSELRGKNRQQFPSWMAFTDDENVDKFNFYQPNIGEELYQELSKVGVLVSPMSHFSANQFQSGVIDIQGLKILQYNRLILTIPHSTNIMMTYYPQNF